MGSLSALFLSSQVMNRFPILRKMRVQGAILQVEIGPSPNTKPIGILILDFLVSRTLRNKSMFDIYYPALSILL